MTRHSCSLAAITLSLVVVGPAFGAIAEDIERKTDSLREELRSEKLSAPEAAERIAALEAAIERGQSASGDLRAEIEVYKEKTAELRETKNVLASGLIGAIVTAVVAILGVLANFRRSRAERDLKRLEVLEKASELRSKGVKLPEDIVELLGNDPGADEKITAPSV